MPGQTPTEGTTIRQGVAHTTAFNGGPDNCPAKPRGLGRWCVVHERGPPSMEGRTIARPNGGRWLFRWRTTVICLPSMEGRTIARPNHLQASTDHARPSPDTFNGGPDNCPAKPVVALEIEEAVQRMDSFNGGPDNCPAKPSPRLSRHGQRDIGNLQWRAGQLPGQTSTVIMSGQVSLAHASLQWRAGQLPGQTARLIWGR